MNNEDKRNSKSVALRYCYSIVFFFFFFFFFFLYTSQTFLEGLVARNMYACLISQMHIWGHALLFQTLSLSIALTPRCHLRVILLLSPFNNRPILRQRTSSRQQSYIFPPIPLMWTITQISSGIYSIISTIIS